MAATAFSPRTVARATLLGIAATVALTACSNEPVGTISPVPSGPATSLPTGSSASPSPLSSQPTSSPSSPSSTDKNDNKGSDTTTNPVSKKTVPSDVSQLTEIGIDLNVGVLIDVADDGLDAYLAIGKGGVVDFTGSRKTDNTMMALRPAQVAKKTESTKNRVVIAPPFYNEDLGAGSCVADTAPGALRLATCDVRAANQTWQVIPAGDSGQFELHGVNTEIRVDEGAIITSGQGYVGLQTIPFAE